MKAHIDKAKNKRRKKPITPASRVVSALRRLWLYSRERAEAKRQANNTCQICGVKESHSKVAEQKIEVHHVNGIVWNRVKKEIYKHILVGPKKLMVLCPNCHTECHKKNTEG